MPDLKELRALQISYKRTFEGVEGQAVLEDLKKRCRYNTSSYVDGNPHGTAFNEGKRAAILTILDFMTLDIDKLEKQINARKGE